MKNIIAIFLLLFFTSGLSNQVTAKDVTTPESDIRNAEQTFLTYPEWFLVFSPNEFANFSVHNRPGNFPYMAHIGQFWTSYNAVHQRTKDEFPFNGEYHTVLIVIGVSTTLEYGLKGAYEFTIGRMTELTTGNEMTEEDRFGAMVARDYVDFILERPWYEFDFFASFKALWTETSFFGSNMIRKLERKYILSSEYLIKAAYANLIGYGSAASFDTPIHKTAVIAHWPDEEKIELLQLPRYQPFTDAIVELAEQNVVLREIAGNDGRIAISLLGIQTWDPITAGSTLILQQPVITQPGVFRHIIEVEVEELIFALKRIKTDGLIVEHIYDY